MFGEVCKKRRDQNCQMSILSFMIILLNIVFCDRGTSSPTIPSPDGGNNGGVTVIKNVTRKEGESVSFVCDVENEDHKIELADHEKYLIGWKKQNAKSQSF